MQKTLDSRMAKLGFERACSCDSCEADKRWIRTTSPGGSRLFGVTIWVTPVSASSLDSLYEAAIGIDTEQTSHDLAAYETLNCAFVDPVEAAEFALDELREGLRAALEDLA